MLDKTRMERTLALEKSKMQARLLKDVQLGNHPQQQKEQE